MSAAHEESQFVEGEEDGAAEQECEYNNEDFEVEKIIGKRKNKETKAEEFRVLWAGFEADDPDGTSWEPREWLEDQGYDDLIEEYIAAHGGGSGGMAGAGGAAAVAGDAPLENHGGGAKNHKLQNEKESAAIAKLRERVQKLRSRPFPGLGILAKKTASMPCRASTAAYNLHFIANKSADDDKRKPQKKKSSSTTVTIGNTTTSTTTTGNSSEIQGEEGGPTQLLEKKIEGVIEKTDGGVDFTFPMPATLTDSEKRFQTKMWNLKSLTVSDGARKSRQSRRCTFDGHSTYELFGPENVVAEDFSYVRTEINHSSSSTTAGGGGAAAATTTISKSSRNRKTSGAGSFRFIGVERQSVESWVGAIEQLMIQDGLLLRCLASCSWIGDQATIPFRLNMSEEEMEKRRTATNKKSTKTIVGDLLGKIEKSQRHTDPMTEGAENASNKEENDQENGDEEEAFNIEEEEDDEQENYFMTAPTTFHESADILLLVLTFCDSLTFFTGRIVARRWASVSTRLVKARTMALETALNMRLCFLRAGFVPLGICQACCSRKMMRDFLSDVTIASESRPSGVETDLLYKPTAALAPVEVQPVCPTASADDRVKNHWEVPLSEIQRLASHVTQFQRLRLDEFHPPSGGDGGKQAKLTSTTLFLSYDPNTNSRSKERRQDLILLPALGITGLHLQNHSVRNSFFEAHSDECRELFDLIDDPEIDLLNIKSQNDQTRITVESYLSTIRREKDNKRKQVEKDVANEFGKVGKSSKKALEISQEVERRLKNGYRVTYFEDQLRAAQQRAAQIKDPAHNSNIAILNFLRTGPLQLNSNYLEWPPNRSVTHLTALHNERDQFILSQYFLKWLFRDIDPVEFFEKHIEYEERIDLALYTQVLWDRFLHSLPGPRVFQFKRKKKEATLLSGETIAQIFQRREMIFTEMSEHSVSHDFWGGKISRPQWEMLKSISSEFDTRSGWKPVTPTAGAAVSKTE